MSKHTPGPWEISDGHVYAKGGLSPICCDYEVDGTVCLVVRNEANARLIAAAPTLLAALQDVLASAVPNEHEHPTMYAAWANARAAIAKAESK